MQESDIAETLEWLQGGSVQDRATLLGVLAESPTGEPRIRAAVEALLEDHSICVTQPPLRWLELRRIAAEALAAERGAAGIADPVTLRAVPLVMTLPQIAEAAEAAFGQEAVRWPVERRYLRLREAGLLPLADLSIPPQR